MTGTIHALWIVGRLQQDQTWQAADGRVVPIDQMTPAHRRNALRWLRDHAEELHECRRIDLAMSLDGVEAERALHAHKATPPAEWLEDTPLVRRLATLEQRRRFLRHPRRWWR